MIGIHGAVLSTSNPALAVGGLLVGIVVGLTGMGGGALLTPLLVLAFGIPARAAVSSDLVVSLLMKPVGVVAHHKKGAVRKDMVRWMATGSIPAAFAGAALVNLLFGKRSGTTIEHGIGIALLLAAGMMALRTLIKRTSIDGQPPLKRFPTLLIGLLGGFVVGVSSVGSGSLMLVLLAWTYPTLAGSTLVGTDLAQAVPLVASAVLGHLLFGDVRLTLVVPLLIGALPGVWFGAQLTHRLSDRTLRPILAVVLTASGMKLLRFI